MAATIGRLLARFDEPSPHLTGGDAEARLALVRVDGEREEIDANYDRSPGDWPRVEDALRSLADRLATAGDPSVSDAWLSVARATRYQRGRRDDTLSALIEALYWGRGNDHAWSELVDYASAAPHVPMLLALFARVPFQNRAGVLGQLLRMSEGRDRLGLLHLPRERGFAAGWLMLRSPRATGQLSRRWRAMRAWQRRRLAILTLRPGIGGALLRPEARIRRWQTGSACGSPKGTSTRQRRRFSGRPSWRIPTQPRLPNACVGGWHVANGILRNITSRTAT